MASAAGFAHAQSITPQIGGGIGKGFDGGIGSSSTGTFPLAGATFDLDFVNNLFSPRAATLELVDTRSTVKSVINSAGLLSSVAINTLPYTDIGLSNEPAGTYGAWPSVPTASTNWSVFAATVAYNALAAPDGTVSAAKFITSGTGAGSIFINGAAGGTTTVLANTLSTLISIVKAAERTAGQLNYADNSNVHGIGVNFDTTTGLTSSPVIYGDGNYTTSGMFQLGATGWWVVWITGSISGGSVKPSPSITLAAGTASQGMYLAAIGICPGTTPPLPPPSYFATTSAAATRAADSIQIQRTGIGSLKYTFDDGTSQTVAVDSTVQVVLPTQTFDRRLIRRLTGFPYVAPDATINKTIVHAGDSITNFGNGNNSSYTNDYASTLGFTTWIDALSGNTLFVPMGGATGVPGRTAASINTGWASDVLAKSPDYITCMMGTNDLGSTDNSASIISAWNGVIAKNRAATPAPKMVIIPILPRAGSSALTPAAETGRVTVNNYLATLTASDIAVSDISGFDPVAMSQGDGLHPSSVGSEIIGRAAAAALNTLKNSAFDMLSLVSSPRNILGTLGFLTGIGGSLNNGATGKVPAGWTQQVQVGNAGGTTVCSLINNPNGGNWYQIAMSGGTTSTGNNGATFATAVVQAIPAGQLATLMFEFEVDAGWTNFMGVSGTLALTGTTATSSFGADVTYPYPNKNLRNCVARSFPCIVPAGCTGFSVTLNPIFSAGSSISIGATIRLGRVVVLLGSPFSVSTTNIPVCSVAPAITGTAQVGQTLTVSNGTWSNSPSGFTYLWAGAGSVNFAQTGNTYVPVSGDIGGAITCYVFAKNSGGVGQCVSNATANVIA